MAVVAAQESGNCDRTWGRPAASRHLAADLLIVVASNRYTYGMQSNSCWESSEVIGEIILRDAFIHCVPEPPPPKNHVTTSQSTQKMIYDDDDYSHSI